MWFMPSSSNTLASNGVMLTFAFLACALSVTNAFFVMHCDVVRSGRIDPIVSYNKVSGHAHSIGGASSTIACLSPCRGSKTDFIKTSISTALTRACSSLSAALAMSMPTSQLTGRTPMLYYQRKDGSIVEVPQQGLIIYYFATIEPFPPGFKMLAGNMRARSYDTGEFENLAKCISCH